MFRLLYGLIVGQAVEAKSVTLGYVQFFGLLFILTLVYLVFRFGPVILWAGSRGQLLPGIVSCGVIALGLAAASIDTWVRKLHEEIKNEPLRGKPLDNKLEGE